MKQPANMSRKELVGTADAYIRSLTEAGLAGVSDEELVDVVYLLTQLERHTKQARKDLETELPDVVYGEEASTWMTSSGYAYSFNEQRIIADTIDKSANAFEAFRRLFDHGVIRFSGRITSVTSLYETLDVPLVTVPHEIADGDPEAHVGKYRKPKTRKYGPPRSVIEELSR